MNAKHVSLLMAIAAVMVMVCSTPIPAADFTETFPGGDGNKTIDNRTSTEVVVKPPNVDSPGGWGGYAAGEGTLGGDKVFVRETADRLQFNNAADAEGSYAYTVFGSADTAPTDAAAVVDLFRIRFQSGTLNSLST